MFYKNNSFVAKTFYGVTFQPGEIKDVPGYINNKYFDVVDAPKPKEPPKRVEISTKSTTPTDTPKKDVKPRQRRQPSEPKQETVKVEQKVESKVEVPEVKEKTESKEKPEVKENYNKEEQE